MNKINVEPKSVIPVARPGDLLINKSDSENEFYMLALVDIHKYVAISLKDGNRWRDVTESVERAVKGLTFYGSKATINISFEDNENKENKSI